MVPAMTGANPATAIAPAIASAPCSFISNNRARTATDDCSYGSPSASADRTSDNRTGCATHQCTAPGAALRVRLAKKRSRRDCK